MNQKDKERFSEVISAYGNAREQLGELKSKFKYDVTAIVVKYIFYVVAFALLVEVALRILR